MTDITVIGLTIARLAGVSKVPGRRRDQRVGGSFELPWERVQGVAWPGGLKADDGRDAERDGAATGRWPRLGIAGLGERIFGELCGSADVSVAGQGVVRPGRVGR